MRFGRSSSAKKPHENLEYLIFNGCHNHEIIQCFQYLKIYYLFPKLCSWLELKEGITIT